MKSEVNKLNSSNNKLTAQQETELINTYTRNPVDESKIYVFTVTLCDNEVDRDFERFSKASLEAFASCSREKQVFLITL